MNDTQAKVALITGAGSGIGRAIAIGLGREGFSLCLVGRTLAKLEETAALCATPTLPIEADLADTDRAAECVDRCVERFGGLDVLVNSAGVAPLAPIEKTTDEILEETFYANAFGPAALLVRAWPVFKRQRRGRVVNISTIGALDPFPGFLAYAASKSALDSFTRSIAAEGKAIGVRAFSVNPGAVETPLLRSNFGERVIPREKTLAPEAVAAVAIDCALGRRDGDNGRTIPMPSPS